MSMVTVQTKTTLEQGFALTMEAGSHKWASDQPAGFGGKDSGPTPMDLLMAGLGGCMAQCARVYAEQLDVKLDAFSVEVEGDWDPDGFLGQADVPMGFQNIRFKFNIDSPSDQKNIDALLAKLPEVSPVRDTYRRALPVEPA
jgi:uncharacterized OsmC-like protein